MRRQVKKLWAGFRRQSIAGMLVYLLAFYALALSALALVAAIELRIGSGQWLFAGAKTDPLYEAGGSLGFYAALLFALNFVLATRWRWVERLFGGLAQVYALHGFAGRTALSFIVLHSAILMLQALPDWSLLLTYIVPGADLAYTLGMVGTLGLLVLVALTIWVKLPHGFWLKTHRLMIVPFLGGTLHAIVLQLDWYMMLTAAVGTSAWLYTQFVYPNRAHPAEVSQARTMGEVRELVLAPANPVAAAPGQFAFLSVPSMSDARHPFSISGIDAAGRIRMSIRKIGGFTHGLERLAPGQNVRIHGPHGSFGHHVLRHADPQVWIAGGIGITPFLSLLQALSAKRSAVPVRLIWSVREAGQAVYGSEIEDLMRHLPNGRFELRITADQGRLSAHDLLIAGEEPRFFICGPAGMVETLQAQLLATGVSPRRITAERFAMR